jgi:hypothetical protein
MTWQTKVVRGTLALGLLATFAMAAGAGWLDGFGWLGWLW